MAKPVPASVHKFTIWGPDHMQHEVRKSVRSQIMPITAAISASISAFLRY